MIDFRYLIIDLVRDFLQDLLDTSPELIGRISRLYFQDKEFKGPNGGEMDNEMLGSRIIYDLQKLSISDPHKAESIARGLLRFGRNKKIIF